MKILKSTFFNQSTLVVAEELLGKIIVFKKYRGIITETEAYIGAEDPACHAFRGETPRTKIMFGKAGFSYVYLIYGMYHCLNFVTEKEGYPAAVLIRGVKLLDETRLHLNGPGKICRHMGITREYNGLDITMGKDLYVEHSPYKVSFTKTPRIGIKVGTDKLWRFVVQKEALTVI